jgi:hypothetical protein
MGAITEEKLMQNLDFECARCQAKCSKVNALEPELFYLSQVDGSMVGPLCTNCWNQIPANSRVVKKIPQTAFLVVIKQDGEGTFVTTEDVSLDYMREPTYQDIIDGCNQVANDVKEAMFAQKITSQIIKTLAGQKNKKIITPR